MKKRRPERSKGSKGSKHARKAASPTKRAKAGIARKSGRSAKAAASASSLAEYERKRDFRKTPEPARSSSPRGAAQRHFVVQKHAARRTHFDLRLEWGGTLKSWAVPKGPSLDPKEKRLAVHVEDHPVEYASFEGRIPKGEYGAGPVIIWDHGTYVPIYPSADATDEELEEGLRDGKVEFELFGERMKGKWGLIRIRGSAPGDAAGKEPFLLLKKKDEHASTARDLVSEYHTSVVSGLTLQEVNDAGAKGKRVRARGPGAVAAEAPDFQPMLAERSEELPGGSGWVLEEKIDGVRVIVRAGPEDVRFVSRTGQRLEPAFPEVAQAVRRLAERSGASFVLDGELAIRDARGRARFEEIQPRINLKNSSDIQGWARRRPAELFLFDCLWANGLYFADRPLMERKVALRELLRFADDGVHELAWWDADAESGDIWRRAQEERWEGLVAKRPDSRYLSGRRSREWVKVKLVNQEEFVVVGWTDPEGGRSGFGALLLGYHDEAGKLRYAGRAGTGFSAADLAAIAAELAPLETATSPCVDPPDEAGLHWVEPRLVAAVKFQEWTKDRRLRAPVFLGLRRDKPANRVRITGQEIAGATTDLGPAATPELDALLGDLERAEATGKDLRATADGVELTFTNLAKVLWPEDGVTKGDLLRYYARVSPWLCPALADRPLHLERYPDGIDGERFWQQRAPSPAPQGIPTVAMEDDGEEVERLVGGSPATLLYTTQLAAIPQHPWPSRVGSLESMDYAILDLDPGPEVTFDRVRDVARWARDELDRLDLVAFLKTSGGRGLHIVIPLGPGATYETGRLLTQLVAALVQRRHRARATLERTLKKRPQDKVYLDCFQNEYGKTIASVYSVRPRPGAPVSTPLRWDELDADLDPLDFRLRDVFERFESVGDLWAPARTRANRVEEVIERLETSAGALARTRS